MLWPTFTIVIGSTSAAALPGVWSRGPSCRLSARSAVGPPRRPAGGRSALSVLSVAAMGGVNAASTGYAWCCPALYILDAASGRRRLLLAA